MTTIRSDALPADERRHVAATVQLLAELSRSLDGGFATAEVRHALLAAGRDEPLEALARAGETLGLKVWPRRMSVAEAIWVAEDGLAVVVWNDDAGRWTLVRRHGFFRARIWTSDEPEVEARTVSRRGLARLLGAARVRDAVDVALVHPARLAEAAVSARAAADGHGDGGGGGHGGGGHGHGHDHAHVSPVRRLFALMRPESGELVTIIVFSAITGLLYLALPLAVNAFISNLSFGTQSGPFLQGLVAIAGVLLVCLAVAAALRGLQHTVAEVIQRRIFVRLGADLAHRLPNVDLEALDGVHAPELVNRFLDVITVQKSASMLLLTGINLVLSATIGLTVLAFYHPFLLAFSLGLLVALGLIVAIAGRRAVSTSVRESRRKYEVVDWLEELARHPRVFKGAGGRELAEARADDLVRGYLEARSAHFRVLMRQISSLLALEVLAATVLLFVGGWLVLSQQLTLGQLVASEIIVSAIVASISKLGKQFEAWYDAVAAVDKLGHLVDLRLEREGGEAAESVEPGARVAARGLSYARLGRRPAFAALSFDIAPGERVALFGARGSGTSSILEIVLGMRTPLEGEVSVDGLDVRSWNLPALRARSAILRSTDLVSGTIADNVRLGLEGVGLADVQRAVERAGLGETVRALPEGLASPLVTGGLPLTGRQRARLLAARALAARPRLVLVDELLDGLDEGTLDDLAKVFLDPANEWTVLVATRDPRVVARCGRSIEIASATIGGTGAEGTAAGGTTHA